MYASDFEFELPDELIAQHPLEPRDRSRLMVLDRRRGGWEHRLFSELPDLLFPQDLLVRNDSRVVPARLVGYREATGGRWEGLFLGERAGGTWEILATTRGHPAPGERVIAGRGLRLLLEARQPGGSWIVRPERGNAEDGGSLSLLEQHGLTPLPPYIRGGREMPGDRGAYQTVFARRPGSVAAPTAGLHFTSEVFASLAARGIAWVDLTLHVGLGTFRPIEAELLEDHLMHHEWAELTPQVVETIKARRCQGGRVVAVGTTSARTLETAAASGTLQPFSGATNLFIQPGHTFRGLDGLLTNFHLPRSTLLVLVSAFAGADFIRAAYAEAIRCRYRFLSYGDAMLIL